MISITELGSNTNSVRRIIPSNKDINNKSNNYRKNLTDYENRKKQNPENNNYNSNSEANEYYDEEKSPNNKFSIEENDNYLEYEREKRSIIEGKKNNESEDWADMLKQSNMTREEYNYHAKNRALIKIVDLIENLNKLVRDKNFSIRILLEENKNLNVKNEELNKENISLNKQIMNLLKESIKNTSNNDAKTTKGDTGIDSSMVI